MRFIWLFFMLFSSVLMSCNNYKVISFNNPDFTNKNYQSYKLITKAPDSLLFNQKTLVGEVHDAIINEMKVIGYEQVSQKSDLILRYKFFSNNRSEVNSNFRNRPFSDPTPFSVQTRNVNESILLIDLHDRKDEKLVWQGSVDLNLSTNRRRKANDEIPTIVNEIFKTYQIKRAQ